MAMKITEILTTPARLGMEAARRTLDGVGAARRLTGLGGSRSEERAEGRAQRAEARRPRPAARKKPAPRPKAQARKPAAKAKAAAGAPLPPEPPDPPEPRRPAPLGSGDDAAGAPPGNGHSLL